jgi:glycosyltransferase involved in cell wall biosynthesis
MKILIVNDYGVPAGGAERVSLILRDGLRERGHDARLFASSARPVAADNPADYTCLGTESGLRRVLQVANPSAALGLRRLLRAFRPDLVHVRMFLTQLSPFILPALRGVPALLHVGNYQTICPLNTKRLPDGKPCHHRAGLPCLRAGCVSLAGLARTNVQLGLWRRWRDVFPLIVANSEALAVRLRAEGVPVTTVIHNGTPLRAARPPLEEPPVVAYAGRLVGKKGVEVLLEAMARLRERVPDCRLIIAGDGPGWGTIEKRVARLGLQDRTSMPGFLHGDELERRLAVAWVHAVPSRYEEPFPNTAIEAMMRGTAVVASAVGGCREIVRDGVTGLLVPPGDPGALANALETLLSNRELAARMGTAARSAALQDFHAHRMLDAFEAAYHSLLGTTAPTPLSVPR